MSDPTALPFAFPSVRGKKLTAAFDGGRLTSDGGVLLLAQAARRLAIADRLAAVIPDQRDPTRIVHPLAEILLARILAIADAFNALTSERPYKEAFPLDRALETMGEGRGTHFDPDILDTFVAHAERIACEESVATLSS